MRRSPIITILTAALATLLLLLQAATLFRGPWCEPAAAAGQPQGALLVRSTLDSGPGSLRQALLDA
jgi:hypothetical protein